MAYTPRLALRLVLALLAGSLALLQPAYAAPGDLDTTFDTDGKVTTAIGSGASGDEARAMAIQSDGKIVVAGGADLGSGATGYDIAVVRYLAAHTQAPTSTPAPTPTVTPTPVSAEAGPPLGLAAVLVVLLAVRGRRRSP